MQKIGLWLLAFMLFTACKRDEVELNFLQGRWEWISTDGGIANHMHQTPGSTGNSIVMEFQQNNRFKKYINGALASEGSYSLTSAKCIHDHSLKQVVHIPSEGEMMIESVNKEYLHLSDERHDGLNSHYKRADAGAKD